MFCILRNSMKMEAMNSVYILRVAEKLITYPAHLKNAFAGDINDISRPLWI